MQAQEASGLGFLGADVAIDKERGPVFLELNARPGLSIQIANLAGLKERLERVKGIKIKTLERGIRVGMDLFGGEIEEEVEEISGKKVIGVIEKVKVIGKDGKEAEVEAKIDTGAGLTAIDFDLARQLGFEKTVEEYQKLDVDYEKIKDLEKAEKEEVLKGIPDMVDTAIIHSSHGTTLRPMVRISFVLDGFVIPAKASIIDRSHLEYPMIIGKRNLGRFLVDVNK